jgi:hypothetical protein
VNSWEKVRKYFSLLWRVVKKQMQSWIASLKCMTKRTAQFCHPGPCQTSWGKEPLFISEQHFIRQKVTNWSPPRGEQQAHCSHWGGTLQANGKRDHQPEKQRLKAAPRQPSEPWRVVWKKGEIVMFSYKWKKWGEGKKSYCN